MARVPDVTKAIEAAVARALRAEVSGDVRALKKKVHQLEEKVRHLSRIAGRAAVATGPSKPPSKGRQLQGRYIGFLRNLTKKNQARVKSIRKNKGVEAAIREARQLRKK